MHRYGVYVFHYHRNQQAKALHHTQAAVLVRQITSPSRLRPIAFTPMDLPFDSSHSVTDRYPLNTAHSRRTNIQHTAAVSDTISCPKGGADHKTFTTSTTRHTAPIKTLRPPSPCHSCCSSSLLFNHHTNQTKSTTSHVHHTQQNRSTKTNLNNSTHHQIPTQLGHSPK